MLANYKINDKVLLNNGIIGTIVSFKKRYNEVLIEALFDPLYGIEMRPYNYNGLYYTEENNKNFPFHIKKSLIKRIKQVNLP